MTYRLMHAGGRPPTTNAERTTAHWAKTSITVKQWRIAFAWIARADRIPKLGAVAITAVPHHKDRRSPQDVGACHPAVKAAVDGLVDASVLPNDGPTVVQRITYTAPEVDGWDGLELILEEL